MFRTVLFSLLLAAGLIAAFVAIADAQEPQAAPGAPAMCADSNGANPPPATPAMSPAPAPGAIVAVVGMGWG